MEFHSFRGDLRYTRPGKRLQKTMENTTMLFMGKLTISMVIFNSKLLVYQRVLGSWIHPSQEKKNKKTPSQAGGRCWIYSFWLSKKIQKWSQKPLAHEVPQNPRSNSPSHDGKKNWAEGGRLGMFRSFGRHPHIEQIAKGNPPFFYSFGNH